MTATLSHMWNTGAQYTANGQRIYAELFANNIIFFYDIDRGVGGMIDIGMIYEEWQMKYYTVSDMKEDVMVAYLNNHYKTNREYYAWQSNIPSNAFNA